MRTARATRAQRLAGILTVFLAVVLGHPALGEDFDFCSYFGQLPNASISDQNLETVLEDPGVIKILHGFAQARHSTGTFIKLSRAQIFLVMPRTLRFF